MNVILNQDQKAAVSSLFQFLSSDDKEFIISGPAGTGKTYLMKHVIKHLLPEYKKSCQLLGLEPVPYVPYLTATTNKAAEVLGTTINQNLDPGTVHYQTSTIHSFLGLKVKDNYETGVSEIEPTNSFTLKSNCVIFIDEASMIDRQLHKYIELATDRSCKIIYIGDHCQMAPVMEKLSPIYLKNKNFALLNTPVRNAEQPALMSLCSNLRNTVETLDFFKIQPVPTVIEYLTGSEALTYIDSTFADFNVNSRILCYTNARVQEYNDHIRSVRGLPSYFSQGERIINNTAMYLGAKFLACEQEFVVRSNPTNFRPFYFFEGIPEQQHFQMDVYDIELEDPCSATSEVITATIPVDPEDAKRYLRFFAKNKDWVNYFKIKNRFPDLRSRDACTVYKAQGSTYDSVFLDLTNIGKCTQADQLARMLYVGASRAKHKVYLYGELPKRLFT